MASNLPSIMLMLICIQQAAGQSPYRIVHLTEFVRHGARTTCNNLLNLNMTKSLGEGNLTANGIRMHFVLGSQLRKNYPEIFGGEFKPKDVEVKSSPVYRCIQSAMSHLMGVFPLGTGDIYTLAENDDKGLPPWNNLEENYSNVSALPRAFRPFPYSVLSPEIDDLFFPSLSTACPNADFERSMNLKQKSKLYEYLIKDITKELEGIGIDPALLSADKWTISLVAQVYDEFKSYLNYHGTRYPGISDALQAKMEIISTLNFKLYIPTEKFERLMSDSLLRDIIKGMDDRLSGESQATYRLLSGHDDGIFAHMLRYGLTSEACLVSMCATGTYVGTCHLRPDFASSFVYELAVDGKGVYYARLLFDGKPIRVCEHDEGYCQYEMFRAAVVEKLFYSENDKKEFCGNPMIMNYEINKDENQVVKVLILIIAGILVISLCAIAILIILTWNIEVMPPHKMNYRTVATGVIEL